MGEDTQRKHDLIRQRRAAKTRREAAVQDDPARSATWRKARLLPQRLLDQLTVADTEAAEAIVYRCHQGRRRHQGAVSISQEAVSTATGYALKTAERTMHLLERLGVIGVIRRGPRGWNGWQTSLIYLKGSGQSWADRIYQCRLSPRIKTKRDKPTLATQMPLREDSLQGGKDDLGRLGSLSARLQAFASLGRPPNQAAGVA